jgi:hypothetical protein
MTEKFKKITDKKLKNFDPDPDPIQGFDDRKIKKNYS